MDDKIAKLAQINKAKADNLMETLKHDEMLDSSVKISSTVLSATASLIKYLEGHITKTEVVNQLTSIDTPDVFEVVDAVNNLHDTLKTHKDTDLTEITSVMQSILDETKLIPKTLPEETEQKFIDYSDQLKSLKTAIESVGKFVKEQKLVAEAPVVNVASPTVNVDAPDLAPLQTSLKAVVDAVKAIVIPEFKTDNKALETLVKASNVLLKKILDKPVSSGGGGGGGRATPYQDAAGIPAFVELTATGKIPVDTSIDTSLLATKDNQTNGTQKIQIVDAGGDAVSVTGGKLDVNSSAPVGGATEAKQDTTLLKLADILTELAQKTEAGQNQQVELINVLQLLVNAIANPSYVDKSLNSMRIGNNTVTFAANQDIRTVTTLTNFGSFPADHLQRMDNMTAWATNIRQEIT